MQKMQCIFYKKISGVSKNEIISSKVKQNIYFDFRKLLTYKQIADNYCVSYQTIINLFD